MKTIKKVEIIPVFLADEEFMPDDDEFEERTVYISKKYSCVIHRCLCGCGEKTVMPLNNEVHPTHGWDLIENGDKVTFKPSIANNSYPCKSHYIITNNVANFV